MKPSPFEPQDLSATAKKSGPEAEERVTKAVVDAVHANRLLPGDRLIERELAMAAGAGRMAIRNGLLRLANAKLVELSRNRGATIIQCTPDEARQIFEARITIEDAALRKLARIIDDQGLARLTDIARREAEAYAHDNVEQANHHARYFHTQAAELADNDLMTRFLRDLINCQPLLSAVRGGELSAFNGAPAHEAIIRALANRDGEKAAHINTRLLKELETELVLKPAQSMEHQADTKRKTASRAQKARRGPKQTQ